MNDAIQSPPQGVIGASLTAFGPNGRVDHNASAKLIDLLCSHCDAISVLGAEVSEYQVLSQQQRRTALKTDIEAVAGRVPVLAGASHYSVAEVGRLSETAANAGASFVQVLIPLTTAGNAANQAEIVRYFEQVAEVSALPVVAYHNPPRGSDANANTMIDVSRIDRIVAFKESSRDISKIGRLCAEIDEAGYARYFTTMQGLLPTLLMGGSGAMMPPPGTLIGSQVYQAFSRGELNAASDWQRGFRTFPGPWGHLGLAAVMKAALTSLGLDFGEPTIPGTPLADIEYRALTEHLEKLGVPELFNAALDRKGTRT